MTSDIDALAAVLHATAPHAPLADRLETFGRFVGAWDLEWHGIGSDGLEVVVPGELTFGWILGGRALQDVWRVPLDPADARRMRAFHGTTVRFYDPAIDAWRSTWLDPVNGRIRRFIGRPLEGGDIVLDGLDDDPRERWSFHEVTSDSFRWLGEASTDGGRTWSVTDEMLARRRR